MNKMKKVRTLFSLDRKTVLLLLEAFLLLGWARILISIPFSKVAPGLGAPMEETGTEHPSGVRKAVLMNVHDAIQTMSRHTFWESKCLVRAIAAAKMLERRRFESTLYLGTAKDESGRMIAHAWLRSGSFYITGAAGMERYTIAGKFAKYVRN
ncbi:lasso peptide biosynthesis B2 protein [Paenibacillus sp. N4]|uniref:lasso peptide biosynthesis B2 protein n=1 Tax=Paenibacillus vietnamensis TaxID=2590547 RepID=UPI001CD0FDA6|nr:lasso peptide biosynthesis B2 protein [Paenibacillus vietnamensis]MCA0755400.1 lasso peptide biosynthesis B2 protein [Paenibacillus vietnamensis]